MKIVYYAFTRDRISNIVQWVSRYFFVGTYRAEKKWNVSRADVRSRFRTRVILFPDSSFPQVPQSFRTAACRIARTDIAVRAASDEGRKFRYRGSKWFWVGTSVAGFPICEIAREIVRLWGEINDRPSTRYTSRPNLVHPTRIGTFSLVPLSINRLSFLRRLPVASRERWPPSCHWSAQTCHIQRLALSIYPQTCG